MSRWRDRTQMLKETIHWALESMEAMVDGHAGYDGSVEDSAYVKELEWKIKTLRAYRDKRFGKPIDLLAGCGSISMAEMLKRKPQKFRFPGDKE